MDTNTNKIIIPNAVALLPADLSRGQISVITLIAMVLQRQIVAMAKDKEIAIDELFGEAELLPDGEFQTQVIYGNYGIDCRWFRTMVKASEAFGENIKLERSEDVQRHASCLIKLSQRALALFLDFSKGYFYADPKLSIRAENKSDVRMYWLVQMYSSMKGFTMSVPQLRSILGASKSYDGYYTFEERIVCHAQHTLSSLFEQGLSNTSFSFVRIFNHPYHFVVAGGTPAKGHGKPDALKFTIVTKDLTNKSEAVGNKSINNDVKGDAEIIATLRDELHLPEKLAIAEAARVSKDCKEDFINFAISIKEIIDDKASRGEKLKKPAAYVCKCLHNYFLQRDTMAKLAKRKMSDTKPVAQVQVAAKPVAQVLTELKTEAEAKEESKPRHSFEELSRLWKQVMTEYDGVAKDALLRATFKGEERDVFWVQFASEADKELCEKDYSHLNSIARRVLNLPSRFQPGVIMDVKQEG